LFSLTSFQKTVFNKKI